MKDFFISYTGRDRTWAEWIAWTLEEAGYSVVIQAWDFRPGGNFVLDMQQAVQANRTIAVLSALYLDKPFTQSEWAAAFAQDPTSRDHKLIPVRVEECHPPGLLAQIVYVDIFDCEEAGAKERLLSAIAEGRMKPTQRPRFPGKPSERVPFPGGITPAALPSSPSPDPLPSSPGVNSLSLSTYDESTWVGRDDLISDLTQKLESGCRILTILGITGIGKTALAERVVVGLQDKGLSFQRLNFDDRGQGRDFLSGALALLPKLGEVVTTEDQKDAQNALKHLLQALRNKPFLVQIDSLEMLLEGDEQQGWSAFSDELWLDFFQQLLAGQDCQSQVIITTQALPEELEVVASRYPLLWHLQLVGGLSEGEQLQLFHKNGLMPDEIGNDCLRRIGKLYDGHPLVLQVIAKDILGRPFNGNVAQYWQRYQGEFDEAENDRRQRGSSPRALQLRVKKRVEESLKRLPHDAYHMLCRSSVYRKPVAESFWLAMLWDTSEASQWSALEVLRSYNLVEEEIRGDGMVLLRQHNLIKRVSGHLLRVQEEDWRESNRTAAQMWVEGYAPDEGAPNLEKVRGELEAFHHHCELEDWESAKTILLNQKVGYQLRIWGYSWEMIRLHEQLIGKVDTVVDVVCERVMGSGYWYLGNYPEAIKHGRRSLAIAREINDRVGEETALGDLGYAYYALSDYPQALTYHQLRLNIAREIGSRDGEGTALAGLGMVYAALGNFSEAIKCQQESLTITREIGNRNGEGNALGCLGNIYCLLGQYSQAIDCQQQLLQIAQEIGKRRGEADALGNLGNIYSAMGQYPEAIECYQKCLQIVRDVGQRRSEGITLTNWSEALLKLERYPEAQHYLQIALDIFKSLGERAGAAEVLLRLSEVHHKTKHPDLAFDYGNQALSIAAELGIPLVKECEEFLATLQLEREPT